jgi:hypothetical protein
MRRLLLLFVLLPAASDAASLAEIKTAIENFQTTHGAKIVARQEAYAANHGGRYWQGIITPAVAPDDGASVVADYTKHPTDQTERWTDVFTGANILPANIPCQIRVDVYDGPLGTGWTVTLQGTKSGVLYWRTWNVGPETWRQTGWLSRSLP